MPNEFVIKNGFISNGDSLVSGSFTATTISATTYFNLPDNVTGSYLPLSGGTVTGGTIFTSGVTANTISQVNYIDFKTSPTVPSATGGTLYFDSNENALSYKPVTNQNDVTVNLGQESLIRVYNNLGSTILNGQVLHITGSTSGTPTVALANASKLGETFTDSLAQSSGVATHDIPSGEFGFMTNFGIVRDLNTSAFTPGQEVFLSDTIDGALTNDPNNIAFTSRISTVGYCLESSPTNGKILVVITNENPLQSLTQQEINVLLGNTISTGAYFYTGATTASTTTINVSPMRGWIVYNTGPTYATNPLVLNVYYSGGTNIPVTGLTSSTDTYLLVNSGGTLYQTNSFPSPIERRQNIFLARIVHPNKTTILNIEESVDYDVSPLSSLRDLWVPIKLINEGVVPSPNGATLTFKTSSGTFWGNGIGFSTNELNPNSITVPAYIPASFYYTTQTGGTFTSTTTTVDTLNYDVGGVKTPVPGAGSYTTQRIYMSQSGVIRLQYGQNFYSTLAKAIAAIPSETFVVNPDNSIDCILIGLLTVKDGTGDLSNPDDALFTFVSKFGEILGGTAGISTTTLQQAYDNSITPEIVINSTLDGVTIKNGTGNADNITNLLEGVNTAGTTTSFIRADGGISGNGISATTISATTISGGTFFGDGSNLTNVQNIYNNDGFLQSNRILDLSGKTLTIKQGSTGITQTLLNFVDGANRDLFQIRSEYFLDTDPFDPYTGDSSSIYIGLNAGVSATGTSLNTVIGSNALRSLVSGGSANVAVGSDSLRGLTGGCCNVGIGDKAGGSLRSGIDNIFIGQRSGRLFTGGSFNVLIGANVVNTSVSGSNNIMIGKTAGNNVIGDNNVMIGREAGGGNPARNSSGNVFIGHNAGRTEIGSNLLYIENTNSTTPLIYGDFLNDLLRFNAKVAVNVLPTTFDFDVNGTSRFNGATTFGSTVNSFNLANSYFAFRGTGTSGFGIGFIPFNSIVTPNQNITAVSIMGGVFGTITYGVASGNNTFNNLGIEPTINTSGGTNLIRGVFFNPTLSGLTGTTIIGFQNTVGNNLFNSTSGNTGIGLSGTPTNKLHVSASTDPVRFEGLQTFNSDMEVLTTDTNGVLHKRPYDYVTGFTYNNNTFTIRTSSGNTFDTLFNILTGLTINGNLIVTGTTNISGVTTTSGNVNVNGNITNNGNLVVTGNTNISGVTTTSGNVNVNGNLTVTGNTNVAGLTATTLNGVYESPLVKIGSVYTATTANSTIEITGGTFNLTLYSSSGNTGRTLYIKNSGTGVITILPNGSNTIESRTSQKLGQFELLVLQSDGVGNWYMLNRRDYTIQFAHEWTTGAAPTDNTTYYFGNFMAQQATTAPSESRQVIAMASGWVTYVSLMVSVAGTLATSEDSTLLIRNVTTSTSSTITTTLEHNVASQLLTYTLATPLQITKGDVLEMRWTTPNWGTNPAAVRHVAQVLVN